MLEHLTWLVPLLPMSAAAWIALGYLTGQDRGESGEGHTARVTVGATSLSLLLVLALDTAALLNGTPGQIRLATWLSSGEYRVGISFTLDTLGLSMATVVALVSFLTLRFSVNYMHREPGFHRFFMILSLFVGAMLLIVMAGNAALAFVGWELAGVSSYLLIAYAFDRTVAATNATRAFVTNRIGDAGFLLAIYFCFAWLGDIEWPVIVGRTPGLDSLHAALIGVGFVLAALVKSGQVPFSPWITRALEGPTPSSAVFYGSLMVHAGVYLIIRLEPLMVQAPALMAWLVVLGLLTALYGFLGGLVQADVKTGLIFSTLGQVGLMFMECGLGWFDLAAWHLAAHALWRAYQFLSAPALMHLMGQSTRPVPKSLQRFRGLYTAALHRFWLDQLADWLLVKPTHSLGRDVHTFDAKVVNRMAGLPGSTGAVSSLAQWEAVKQGGEAHFVGDTGDIGRGQGAVGRLMEWVASILHWFEEHLVLKGGGEGLIAVIRHVGGYLIRVEQLLSHPRYLLLMILATFVVIL